jgi:Galactose-3-O-sulfotransferase
MTGSNGAVLVFLHHPKTGGVTLEGILRRKYRRDETYDAGIYPNRLPSEVASLPPDRLARIRVIYGHMRFGVHDFLPRPSRYMTLLRDPVERAISQYYFILRNPGADLHEKFVRSGITLHQYVSGDDMFVNGQTRDIAGEEVGTVEDLMSPRLLARAKENVDQHFALVGVTERFDETLLLAREIFGWRGPVFYRRGNVNEARPRLDQIPRETLELIRERNRLDAELHRFATERLQEEVTRRGAAFERRLRMLRSANAGLAAVPSAVFSLRRRIAAGRTN